ncbi:MAG: sulfatase-like hydrolase/transferase [Solirubrobacteraceae bacterium]
MSTAQTRRQFLTATGAAFAGAAVPAALPAAARAARSPRRPPNLVVVMVDDLGLGELGAYGQDVIATPNLDRVAGEGVRFSSFYAGGPVCAPSRCAMLTGLHTGHCTVRENPGTDPESATFRPEDVTFAEVVRAAGYRTGLFGKWGFGPRQPGHHSYPTACGFDEFLGFIGHGDAHEHYPAQLFGDEGRMALPENEGADVTYASDLFLERSLDFVERHRERPFLLLFTPTIPHAPHDVPSLEPYEGQPWPAGSVAHAAQVTRLDDYVGRLVRRLERLGIADDTVVFFASDNGPHEEGGQGHTPAFFDATAGLRGHKRNLYEGGIRAPLIAWSPHRLRPRVERRPWAVWDLFPTLAGLAGAAPPPWLDGRSLEPGLTGRRGGGRGDEDHLYWYRRDGGSSRLANEIDGGRLQQVAEAVRRGRWKAVRFAPGRERYVRGDEWAVELYDLEADPGETTDVAAGHPEVVAGLVALMRASWRELPYERETWTPEGLAVEPPQFLVAGEGRHVDTVFTNHGRAAARAALELRVPAGWAVEALSASEHRAVPPGRSVRTVWRVTPPAGTAPGLDDHRLEASAVTARDRLEATAAVNVVVAPPAGDQYVSDLPFLRERNGFGPVERDRSNGRDGALDGPPIGLAGQRYDKGLGVHAESEVVVFLGGGFRRFASDIGIDDFSANQGDAGSVRFAVFADDRLLHESGVLTKATGPRRVELDVEGADALRLLVTNARGTSKDHASWAGAKLVR